MGTKLQDGLLDFAKVSEVYRYEVHCFCKDTYEKWGGIENGGWPENSYFFDTEDEVIHCLAGLVRNKMSGIFFTELIQNDFATNNHNAPVAAALESK